MRISRREFLAASAAFAAGCRRPAPVREIAGGIVGANHAVGHRLRTGDFDEPASVRSASVVICGGGIAGLSAGWKLAKSGFTDFVILELESSAGGNSRYGETRVTPYPWGAHYVPIPTKQSRAVRELFRELDVIVGEENGEPVYNDYHLCHAPEERLFILGKWQEGVFPRRGMTAADADQLRRFRDVLSTYRSMTDGRGRRAFAVPMELSSDDAETAALDRVSMREWLDREGYDSPRLRWWVNYALRDDYGCTIETTSAWAAFHYFCAREVEDPDVLTWPEGNGWIVKRLEERLKDRIVTRALVSRIEGSTVDVLVDEEPVRWQARHVIYALPRFTAKYVIKNYEAPWLPSFSYAPWVVANVSLDRVPAETAWDNVFYESDSLGYVVATHQSLRVAPGPGVLTWYKPLSSMDPKAAREMMLTRPWEAWRDEVVGDLRRAHRDIREQISRVDVMLWGHAMVRPTPGFIFGNARHEALKPHGPVRFAHSDMSGFSLFEEAQYRGVKAAEEIMAELGHPFSSSL